MSKKIMIVRPKKKIPVLPPEPIFNGLTIECTSEDEKECLNKALDWLYSHGFEVIKSLKNTKI